MGQKESRSGINKSMGLNAMVYEDWFNRLMVLACSIFEWKNLPNGISPIFIEKTLFRTGKSVFVKDAELGFMILKVIKSGELNVYEEAVSYKAYSYGYSKDYLKDDCIIIRNNILEVRTADMIELYARRLADIDMTISTNLAQMKKPTLIICDEKELFTMKQLMMKIEGNEPFIYGTKMLDLERFKVLNLDAPFIADKLQEMKETIVNELMTRLGLNNANTDKRERMIVDEVNANNEVIGMNYLTMLATRQQAVDAINEKYDLDIEVCLRFKQEGEDNESLHDTTKDPAGN